MENIVRLNSIFRSIQGEGFNTGKPALFVRFAGCNISCPWCDTDHSLGITMDEEGLRNKILDNMSIGDIIVLTGGEPMMQVTPRLLNLLLNKGLDVCIETNGTFKIKNQYESLWIAVSPKYGHPMRQREGSELKVVDTGEWTHADLIEMSKLNFEHFYLQPQWPYHKRTVKKVLEIGAPWKVSFQTHRFARIK